jgi:DNA-binding NarL/FixJ family response regulator
MPKIRIIIIEDNKLLREGLSMMLKARKDMLVVAALGDRIKVKDKINTLKPNILLVDLGLVNQNSLEMVKSIIKDFPKLKLIVMDLLPVRSDIIQFSEQGVSGFILKDATTDDFINTILSVSKGNKVFPSQMHGSLFSEIVDGAVNELLDSKLIESIRMTDNERIIMEYISKGFTDKEISGKTKMSLSIVKGHIDNILEKMALNSHVQISVYRGSSEDILHPSSPPESVKIKPKVPLKETPRFKVKRKKPEKK